MATRVAVYGATGAIGSMLITHILRSNLLRPGDRVQLIGRHGGKTARLRALRKDFRDAFGTTGVEIEVVPSLTGVKTDIFVMAAGVSPSGDRREFIAANRPIFEDTARELALSSPNALVVVISNPVEFCVAVFCDRFERRRVVGMGAEQDSRRFAGALADDLALPRSRVSASVLGEHGSAVVPLWSSVEIEGSNPALLAALGRLRERWEHDEVEAEIAAAQKRAFALAVEGRCHDAYDSLRDASPIVRAMVEPWVTWKCMGATINATANATLAILAACLTRDDRPVRGQVSLSGEFEDITGICGSPLRLDRDGWRIAPVAALTSLERRLLNRSASTIGRSL